MKYQAGMRISEYLLETCRGAGTFGEVWQARHHIWENEHVAIKLPTEPEYVRYLQREGIVVHGLRHPNVIRVLGFDPYADTPYLVMEYVDGPSLREVLNQHPQGLPIRTVVTVLRGLLQAAQAAHAAGVLHRDLKPGNVLLALGERTLDELTQDDVKVGDFGLGIKNVETLQSIAQSASLARDDALVGTLAYIAPEIRDGRQKPDPRTDLYSVGVLLFEMLVGERPAGAELPSTVRSDVLPVLDDLFRGLYARYDRRYASAEAVLADMDAALGEPRLGQPVPPPPPAGRAPAGEVRYCPACRHVVAAEDQYCTQCRYQLVPEVRRCRTCGGYPSRNDRFCTFCGTVLAQEE